MNRIWNLSYFLIYTSNAINFPQSTVSCTSHKSYMAYFHFTFTQNVFNLLWYLPIIPWIIRSMMVNFQMFENFLILFSYWILVSFYYDPKAYFAWFQSLELVKVCFMTRGMDYLGEHDIHIWRVCALSPGWMLVAFWLGPFGCWCYSVLLQSCWFSVCKLCLC